MRHILAALFTLGLAVAFCGLGKAQAADPLPSWNDGASKQAITRFVTRVTTPGGRGFVPPAQRIAVLDNDGTLWCEQPMPTEFAFVLDRVKKLAPKHPEWKQKQPFKGVLEGDLKTALAGGTNAVRELLTAAYGGITTEECSQAVKDWLATAKHPKTGRPYTDMVYQPMLELLAYLRANGFKTYIVSGGSISLMRPWTEKIYGIPPEQVVGSSIKTKFEVRNGTPLLMQLPEIDFIDDKAGKPVGINRNIGRRPIAAFGNSDGDLQMLQWVTAGKGERFGLVVHHTDAKREYAYDKGAGKVLPMAKKNGWTVVDMAKDWKTVFPQ